MACCGRGGGNKRSRIIKKNLPSSASGRKVQVIAGPHAGRSGSIVSRPRIGVFRVKLDGDSIERDFFASLLRY